MTGRPSNKELDKHRKRQVGKPGRPQGTAGRIKEFHARLLATNGDKVIQTVIKKALDDGDKDQVACLKMCVDRLLPMSYFEKSKGGSGGVNIRITSATGDVTLISNGEEEEEYGEDGVVDVEAVEVLPNG